MPRSRYPRASLNMDCVERVEAGEGHELEAVAQLAELVLERRDLSVVEVLRQLNDGEQL